MFYWPKKEDLGKTGKVYIAVVLKGSITYTIFEVVDEEQGEYKNVAQAQLMKDIAFPSEPHNLPAEFVEENELKRLTIM
jgi:hypothetical protein